MQIKFLRLDFQVDYLKPDQNMKTESQRLDLQALNRASQTQDVIKKYSFKTMPTNYIVGKMGLIPNFSPLGKRRILGIFYYRAPDKYAVSTVALVDVRNPTQNK